MAPPHLILLTLLLLPSTTCFLVPRCTIRQTSPTTVTKIEVNNHATPVSKLHANQNDDDEPPPDLNPLAKASWYAVESFGKLFGSPNQNPSASTSTLDLTVPPSSVPETIRRIKLDNDRFYFLSGQVDRLCYAEDCVFSDPFVSFEGRDRFVENLQNLGSFVTEYDVRQLGYEEGEGGTRVDNRVMVKLELNLPWKPILAWPWGVRYDIDPDTFLISNHKESWDIDPWEGVKQIFRKPTGKINKR